MQPLVSVIIATYNGEKYLAEAIESVLAQSYRPIELLLIDDGSDDGTEKIAENYAANYLYQPNQGQPAAQNVGIQKAQGSLIAFLDADDLYMPDKIALQVGFLRARPDVDLVFGYVEQFVSPELRKQFLKTASGYLPASGLFRKECFERVGRFNEQQRIGSFIEWYMRAIDQGLKSELMPFPMFQRRIHGNNLGIRTKNAQQKYLQLIKAALIRRGVVAQ